MNNLLIYGLTILIWGTTWFAIKLQTGHAPVEISILYRALLAFCFLYAWCYFKKISLKFSVKDHLYLCLLGLSMFSLHFLFVYRASGYLYSGTIAVVFSGVSFLGLVNNYIFYRIKPKLNTVIGTLMGMGGLCIFFWDQLAAIHVQTSASTGLGLACIGAIIFSLGSVIGKRNNTVGIDIIPSMTMALAYGALAMVVINLIRGNSFTLPTHPTYWASLLYLSFFGSVIAFLCYLRLIKNIGIELAGYVNVICPMVALIISWAFEGYQASFNDFIGFTCVVLGNVSLLIKRPKAT